ncbi:MAG: hypothetical protein QOD32_3376 [Pyrinomonadaceae bacterium]|jgi:hypothetical protein|nr:hypothetical protein [Pyrinomonadaceae bacterium]
MAAENPGEKTNAHDDVSESLALLDNIPEKQWELPIGFETRGERLVTLRELIKERPEILPGAKLTDEQRHSLVARRIQAQRKFELSMYGVDGIIDKKRAIHEVTSRSRAGNIIAKVEMMMIEDMINLARGEKLAE